MEFLGVGPLELILVVLIALIVLGPKDMARTGRSLGRWLNKVYRSETWKSLSQASRSLRTLPNRLAREAELEELKQVRQSLQETGQEAAREIRSAKQEGMDAWMPHPLPAPTPTGPAPEDTGGEDAGT
jgi:sec-independent protein translocase protein TatB